jgi:hypothetical protein
MSRDLLLSCTTSFCPGCRAMPLPGVLLFGPVFGVTLVQACPRCDLVATDAEAAALASVYLEIRSIEFAGRWYLDYLEQDRLEAFITRDLEQLRERFQGGWFQ